MLGFNESNTWLKKTVAPLANFASVPVARSVHFASPVSAPSFAELVSTSDNLPWERKLDLFLAGRHLYRELPVTIEFPKHRGEPSNRCFKIGDFRYYIPIFPHYQP